MKLKSVRLREVKRFREPVELTNLGPGLNLLVEENEVGKTTLFHALQAVFSSAHDSNTAELRRLKPYAGGAPRVEVEFEKSGSDFTLIKQFLQQKEAVLHSGAGQSAIARGKDVELALAQLLDGPQEGAQFKSRTNLLWLDATAGAAVPEPSGAHQTLLRELVSASAASIASSSTSQALREAIHQELSENLTKNAIDKRDHRARSKGPLGEALTRVKHAERRLEEINRDAARVEHDRAAYADALADRDALLPIAQLEQRVSDARLAYEAAESARACLTKEEAKTETIRLQLQSARERCELDERDAREQVELNAEREAAQKAAETVRARLDSKKQELAKARAALASIDEERRASRAIRLAKRADDLAEKRTALLERRAQVEETNAERTELVRQTKACCVTEALVQALTDAENAIALADAALTSDTVTLSVAYEDPANPTVIRDGSPVEADALHKIDTPTRFSVPGATLHIDPGAQSARDKAIERRASAVRKRDDLLKSGNVASLEDARKEHREQSERYTRLSTVEARLAALAPHGIESLEADIDGIERALQEAMAASSIARQDAPRAPVNPRAFDEIEEDRHRAQQSVDEAAAAAALLLAETASVEQRMEAASARHTQLEARIRPQDVVERARAEHARLLAEYETHAAACVGLRENVLDDTDHQALKAAVVDAEADREEQIRAREALNNHILPLEGRLSAMNTRALDSDRADAEADLASAREMIAKITARIDALYLLDDTLSAVEAERHANLVAPLEAAMRPYLQTLFPDAKPSFEQNLGLQNVIRDGTSEELAALSAGTREQLAAISRLAYAQMLAEQGLETPVVLDDALVYTDDARMAQMFDILEAAAQHHQIFIMTCRASAFDRLDARRVRLRPIADKPQIIAAE